jgi:hypothetical protein
MPGSGHYGKHESIHQPQTVLKRSNQGNNGEKTMKADRQPTLRRPAMYERKVPGELDEGRTDRDGKMAVTVESEDEGSLVTTLTGSVDQAAPAVLPGLAVDFGDLCRVWPR